MLIPRIVERFAQQRRIVGKAAITDVFSRANSDIGIVVLTAFERGERFTDYDLGRETYVVVHVSLAKLDSTFAAQIERGTARAPCLQNTELMSLQNACEVFGTRMTFSRRSARVNFRGYGSGSSCGVAGADARSRRASTVSTNERTRMRNGPEASLSSVFNISGVFGTARALAHEARDFVTEVGIVPATEAYELNVFQIRAFGGDHGARKHTGMEVIYHINQTRRQIDVLDMRHRIGRQNRNAQFGRTAQGRRWFTSGSLSRVDSQAQPHRRPPRERHRERRRPARQARA